jgi:hypothetical protein
MTREEIFKKIFDAISAIGAWIVVGIAILIIYFYYNQELYEKLLTFIVPVGFYCIGILFVAWFRKRKNKNLESGGSEIGTSVYITQWQLLKHDLIMFITPLIMIVIAKLYKGEVGGFDALLSAIAFMGLYASEWIYKSKM